MRKSEEIRFEVLSKELYEETMEAITVLGDLVTIIGEQKVRFEDGSIKEQYLYNKVGYTPANGLPFISLKANMVLI